MNIFLPSIMLMAKFLYGVTSRCSRPLRWILLLTAMCFIQTCFVHAESLLREETFRKHLSFRHTDNNSKNLIKTISIEESHRESRGYFLCAKQCIQLRTENASSCTVFNYEGSSGLCELWHHKSHSNSVPIQPEPGWETGVPNSLSAQETLYIYSADSGMQDDSMTTATCPDGYARIDCDCVESANCDGVKAPTDGVCEAYKNDDRQKPIKAVATCIPIRPGEDYYTIELPERTGPHEIVCDASTEIVSCFVQSRWGRHYMANGQTFDTILNHETQSCVPTSTNQDSVRSILTAICRSFPG